MRSLPPTRLRGTHISSPILHSSQGKPNRLGSAPGVACVTAGPGVANALCALKNAAMARSPLVLLGGATAGLLRGRGALQDVDQAALVHGACKWHCSVARVADIVPMLDHAFFVARSGVPGPVFVELPIDVLYPPELVRSVRSSSFAFALLFQTQCAVCRSFWAS